LLSDLKMSPFTEKNVDSNANDVIFMALI
jgi:hypothetical protein